MPSFVVAPPAQIEDPLSAADNPTQNRSKHNKTKLKFTLSICHIDSLVFNDG